MAMSTRGKLPLDRHTRQNLYLILLAQNSYFKFFQANGILLEIKIPTDPLQRLGQSGAFLVRPFIPAGHFSPAALASQL